jgi:dipeptidase D
MSLDKLDPPDLWKHFDAIRKIPHCSGNEAALAEHILAWAREKGLEAAKDENGNVLVRVPASAGREGAPVVVLQGHMDMVGEKNSDVDHDFAKDPIEVELEGEWLTANGTTLGADNGVGLSAAMAVADSSGLVHGPLELLFTVDEEVGLTGAGKLGKDFVRGRLMLNLDSEEMGAVYIGCSGGGDSTLRLPVRLTKADGMQAASVKVSGLKGGHSGIDIQDQRGNAIRILARLLKKALAGGCALRLVSLSGGNKRNAIPREAEAMIVLDEGGLDVCRKMLSREAGDIRGELGDVDPGLSVELIESNGTPDKAMDADCTRRVLNLLLAIPHGVEAMSHAVPGLVETSNNLATVESNGDRVVVGTSSRSSIASALEDVRDRIKAIGELAGAEVEENEAYPGWKPDPNSHLLAVVAGAHEELFGRKPQIKAIHAGLECGIIGERYPGMEMVSFGPHIEHPHSPDERVNVKSVGEFWKLLCKVLEELSSGTA